MTKTTGHPRGSCGGQLAHLGCKCRSASATTEATEVDLGVDTYTPVDTSRCYGCGRPRKNTCVTPSCTEFDMGNPLASFVDTPIRAWAVAPGDTLYDRLVTDVDTGEPGRSGRIVTVTVDSGELFDYQVNEFVKASRNTDVDENTP